jgi:hypothetical protein
MMRVTLLAVGRFMQRVWNAQLAASTRKTLSLA